MPLCTIRDLDSEAADRVAFYFHEAQRLSDRYERFIEEDDGRVSFSAGWSPTKERASGLHASELSGCQRRAVYSLLDARRDGAAPAHWKRKFRMGHVIHDMLHADFARMSEASSGLLRYEAEVRIHPELQRLAAEYNVQSCSDGLFTIHEERRGREEIRLLVEIKSVSGDEFKRIKRPEEAHLDQAHLYMACLNVPLVWLLYFCKSTQKLTPSTPPFLAAFDLKHWQQLEERAQEAHKSAVLGELPERQEGIQCEFCSFGSVCRPAYLDVQTARAIARASRDRDGRPVPSRFLILAPSGRKELGDP